MPFELYDFQMISSSKMAELLEQLLLEIFTRIIVSASLIPIGNVLKNT